MRSRNLKYALVLFCCLLAVGAVASAAGKKSDKPFADQDHVVYTMPRGVEPPQSSPLSKANLSYHGGPTITSAKVVLIFWGPSFNNAASPDFSYARTLQAYRNQLGTTGEYNTISQYSGIQLTNLGAGTADWFDTSTPPTNVTDSVVRIKVNQYLQTYPYDPSTIYEVVLPRTSYSSSGFSTSCGGPTLGYCAYHGWMDNGSSAIIYAVLPSQSCSGCRTSGFTDVEDMEHFVCHETRSAVTNPTGTGWSDSSGNEADDKCTWSPTPFRGTNGYVYQYEWSNVNGACIRTR
jgi:hypothetical protein